MTPRPVTSFILVVLVGAATLLGGACDRAGQPADGDSNANGNAKGAKSPTPMPAGPSDPDAPQMVSFVAADGVTIVGDLYLPEKTPAPAVLALHQWNSNRGSYKEFAKALRKEGFVVLAVDGPGFGDSTQGEEGKAAPNWTLTDTIDAALDQLESQPAVDALRIGIVGASYGASNALIYGADNHADVRSVALLSVGLNYNDTLPTEPAMKKYGDRPLLMVAARDDAESAAATEKLASVAKSPKHEVKIYDAGGHGTTLFGESVGGIDLVKSFFVRTLTGPIATHDKPVAEGEGPEGGGAGFDGSGGEPKQDEQEGKPQ
jgi:dienelactone hydrolase